MAKTVTLSDDVFELLKSLKPKNLSYSQFLKILLERFEKRKKFIEFLEKGPFINIDLEEEIKELRKRWRTR